MMNLLELLAFFLPVSLDPFKVEILPIVFFLIIWTLFVWTIWSVKISANTENWEINWYGGSDEDTSANLDVEHGSVMEISEAIATPAEKRADIMPGIILIIGLLGTFLGLGLALDKASGILSSADVMQNMDQSMTQLMGMLEGLGAKFKTSTWGLLAFLALKFFLTKDGYEDRRLRWAIEKVKTEFDGIRKGQHQKEAHKHEKMIGLIQLHHQENFAKLEQIVNHHAKIIDSLQILSDRYLENFNQNQLNNQQQYHQLESLINQTKEAIQNSGIQTSQQLQASMQKTAEQQIVSIGKHFQSLQTSLEKIPASIAQMNEQTSSQLIDLIAENQKIGHAMSSFIQRNEDMVNKLGESAQDMAKAATAMGGSATEIGNSAHQLQGVIDDFRQNMEEVISLMKNDLNITIAGMNDSFGQNMGRMSQNLEVTISDMNGSFKDNMTEMSKDLANATQNISKAVNSLSDSVNMTMDQVTKTIGTSMDIQKKAQIKFVETSEHLNENIISMTNLVDKLKGDITGGLKAVSDSNRNVINLVKKMDDVVFNIENMFNELNNNMPFIQELNTILQKLDTSEQIVLLKSLNDILASMVDKIEENITILGQVLSQILAKHQNEIE